MKALKILFVLLFLFGAGILALGLLMNITGIGTETAFYVFFNDHVAGWVIMFGSMGLSIVGLIVCGIAGRAGGSASYPHSSVGGTRSRCDSDGSYEHDNSYRFDDSYDSSSYDSDDSYRSSSYGTDQTYGCAPETHTYYDSNGNSAGYSIGDRYYDSDGCSRGYNVGTNHYDSNGNSAGYRVGDREYDQDGNSVGYWVGDTFYDTDGNKRGWRS